MNQPWSASSSTPRAFSLFLYGGGEDRAGYVEIDDFEIF